MTTPEPAEAPTEDVVRGWFDSLSNWGRWGADDALGTLNFIDDAVKDARVCRWETR